MKPELLTVAARPCGSCPYRRDVPSGVWAASEYDKLPDYDKPTPEQPFAVFLCHQRDGCMCAGWLACHGHERGHELLALRLSFSTGEADRAVLGYTTDVPVFASGAEAAAHGKRGIEQPDPKAKKLVAKLMPLLDDTVRP